MKRENTRGAYRTCPTALLAALVLSLTAVCAHRAYAAVAVPNFVEYAYAVAAGGDSPAMAVPSSSSRPVVITGISTTSPYRGCGFVHAYYSPTAPAVLHWSGVHAANISSLATAQGYTYGGATSIVSIGYNGAAELRTGAGPSTIVIHNNSAVALVCRVTMTY